MKTNGDIKALFMIMNAEFCEEVMEIAREAGIKGATIMNVRGGSAQHATILGITVDKEKDMIISITDKETAEKTMATLKERAGIKTPAHTICFTIPVEKVVGLTSLSIHPGDESTFQIQEQE